MFQKVIVKIHAGVRMKKKIILLILILILCGCLTKAKSTSKIPSPPGKSPAIQITGITVKPRVMNPSKGDKVMVSFTLSRPGKAILKIFDPKMLLINEALCKMDESGLYRGIWDGKDLEGRIVPDEAYFFTIEALDYKGNFAFYDPTTISGGEYFTLPVQSNRKNHNVTYELAKDARVMIKAGIKKGGPLLKTILNRLPRLAGKYEAPWEDEGGVGVIDLADQVGFSLTAEAVTLPENSLLTWGNFDYPYYEYITKIVQERPQKKNRPLFKAEHPLIGLEIKRWREIVPEPKFSLALPGDIQINEDGLPIIQGKVPIKIILDEGLKTVTTEQRYEILFFVDFTFVSEEEGGYSPYTWIWDTKKVNNGEHIITVNIYTLKGGFSAKNIKVIKIN